MSRHGEAAPTRFPSSSWGPARWASPPPPCSGSTASTASSWTAGTASTPSRGPSTSTTRSTGSWSRLGIAEQFAAVSRPTRGLQLIDRNHRVFAVFDRAGDHGRHGHRGQHVRPARARAADAHQPQGQTTVSLRGNVEVTDVAQDGQGRVRVDFTDRLTGEHESVLATYVLGCDGANSVVRTAIGDDGGPQVRAALAGDRRGQHGRARPVGRRAPGLRPRAGRRTCASGTPATAGSSVCSRARPPLTSSPSKPSSPSSDRGSRASRATSWSWRVAEYTFRAQLADRWRDRNVVLPR